MNNKDTVDLEGFGVVPGADARVLVRGKLVCIDNFVETDPDVSLLVKASEDKELAIHHCLAIGAKASKLVRTSIDEEVVHRAFEHMMAQLEDTMGSAMSHVTGVLVGENAELPVALSNWRSTVEKMFDSMFDEGKHSRPLLGDAVQA